MNSNYELPSLRILFAEDVSTDLEMVQRLLRHNGIEFVSECVDTEPDFRKMLDEFQPDIILSDYRMPAFDGMKALRITQQERPDIPFIVLTGTINEDVAVECMRTGADDYVIKQNLKRLIPSIVSAMEKKSLKKAEEDALKQLKSSNVKYQVLIEQSIDAIFMVYKGKLIYVNNNFQELFNVSFDTLTGQNFDFSSIVTPETFAEMNSHIAPALVQTGVTLTFEMQIAFNDGRVMDAEMVFSSLEYQDDIAYQGVIHDITARKKMMRELREAKEKAEESGRLKSAFLATMSHELRTPLNQIIGFSELIPQLAQNEQVKEFAQYIYKSGSELLSLIEDIFHMAMVDQNPVVLRRNKVTISEIAQQLNEYLIELLTESGKLDVITHQLQVDDNLQHLVVITDKPKLIQALIQLLKNAVKFTKEGEIILTFKLIESKVLSISVVDTGIGIPADKLDIIFDFFRQADESLTRVYGGVGIGLALSKKIAESMNAEIKVTTELNKGSVFSFVLPVEFTSNEEI